MCPVRNKRGAETAADHLGDRWSQKVFLAPALYQFGPASYAITCYDSWFHADQPLAGVIRMPYLSQCCDS